MNRWSNLTDGVYKSMSKIDVLSPQIEEASSTVQTHKNPVR